MAEDTETKELLRTLGTEHIGFNEFIAWVSGSKPGEKITYAIGDLALTLHLGGEHHSDLHKVAEAALKASEEGIVCLTQRRVQYFNDHLKRPAKFEYIATKRGK